jgi:hypothetical protein
LVFLLGALKLTLDDVHNVVDRETHTIATREEMARRCFESGLVAPAPVAREAIELHWGPLTAAQRVICQQRAQVLEVAA